MTKKTLFDNIKGDVCFDFITKKKDHDVMSMFRVDQLGFSEEGSGKSDVPTPSSIFCQWDFILVGVAGTIFFFLENIVLRIH